MYAIQVMSAYTARGVFSLHQRSSSSRSPGLIAVGFSAVVTKCGSAACALTATIGGWSVMQLRFSISATIAACTSCSSAGLPLRARSMIIRYAVSRMTSSAADARFELLGQAMMAGVRAQLAGHLRQAALLDLVDEHRGLALAFGRNRVE